MTGSNYFGDAEMAGVVDRLGEAIGSGVALTAGVPAALGPALAVGDGEGKATSGRRNALKSGLLITKVPSRSSVRANHMPSPAEAPIISLCTFLSSGEVVKVMVSCGLSSPCAAFVAPAQRIARNTVSVFSNDCTFT